MIVRCMPSTRMGVVAVVLWLDRTGSAVRLLAANVTTSQSEWSVLLRAHLRSDLRPPRICDEQLASLCPGMFWKALGV